jgi:hypothetical protein
LSVTKKKGRPRIGATDGTDDALCHCYVCDVYINVAVRMCDETAMTIREAQAEAERAGHTRGDCTPCVVCLDISGEEHGWG